MKKAALMLMMACAVITSAQAADKFSENRHVKMGLTCESCHGANNAIAYPTIDQCKTCHDPLTIAEKTKNVKPRNPHVSPHYGNTLDCALCHLQHSPKENYCDQCHKFGFKVP